MKRNLTLTINEELLKTARQHDINISSFLEMKLREYLGLTSGSQVFYTGESSKEDGLTQQHHNDSNRRKNHLGARGVAWHPSTLGW
ncbi:type II toxin-antitoxin system CcdA family antitoxin [Candidatus Woesearchaeota archaeon]|nr:type II toxin-antitoxin system CcdA family antitoxin [Candidatus Woesearchaeota archaeon]